MKTLEQTLYEKKELYEKIKKDCEKFIKKAPKGKIIVSSSHNNPSFYLKTGKQRPKYLSKKNMSLITQLIQKEYCEKLLKVINKRLKQINKLYSTYDENELLNVYKQSNIHKQTIINPLVQTFEDFAEEWQKVKYSGKTFLEDDPEIFTERGERVRSKSEKIIADKLYSIGIPYRYEYPLHITSYMTLYPDFMLLHPKTREIWLWEHMGMMDNPEYLDKALRKIDTYAQHGYFPGVNLILTHETSKRPLDMRIVSSMLEQYQFI